jgi:predicted phosphoribosyltransferase
MVRFVSLALLLLLIHFAQNNKMSVTSRYAFKNRLEAGAALASELAKKYANNPDVVIIALPRGAVPMAAVVAKALNAPLDIVLSKKIGYPYNKEFAIGAIGLEGEYVEEKYAVQFPDYLRMEIPKLREKLKRQYQVFRSGKPPLNLRDKIVIIIDDGIATGKTMNMSIDLIRKQQPKKIVAAIPVGPEDSVAALRKKADEVVCLLTPRPFYAIGQFYQDFTQVEDQEVIDTLKKF